MGTAAGIWAAEAAAIIMVGAAAADTIMAGATIVITKILAVASHCPGRQLRF
jgi:predicted anti-sigma-YlaC factor YlaD